MSNLDPWPGGNKSRPRKVFWLNLFRLCTSNLEGSTSRLWNPAVIHMIEHVLLKLLQARCERCFLVNPDTEKHPFNFFLPKPAYCCCCRREIGGTDGRILIVFLKGPFLLRGSGPNKKKQHTFANKQLEARRKKQREWSSQSRPIKSNGKQASRASRGQESPYP